MVAGYVWFHQHFCYDSMNFDDMYFTTHFALDALKDHRANIHFWCFFNESTRDTKKGQADDISSNKWVNCSNVTELLHHCGTL